MKVIHNDNEEAFLADMKDENKWVSELSDAFHMEQYNATLGKLLAAIPKGVVYMRQEVTHNAAKFVKLYGKSGDTYILRITGGAAPSTDDLRILCLKNKDFYFEVLRYMKAQIPEELLPKGTNADEKDISEDMMHIPEVPPYYWAFSDDLGAIKKDINGNIISC